MLSNDPDEMTEFLSSQNAHRVKPSRRADLRLSSVYSIAAGREH
jgi:hypothetical protein